MPKQRTQNSKGERSHAWLVVLSGDQVGTRHTVALGRTDIGRSSGVTVSLDDDEGSRESCTGPAQNKAMAEGAIAAVSKPVGANALLEVVDGALCMDEDDSEVAITKRHFLLPQT